MYVFISFKKRDLPALSAVPSYGCLPLTSKFSYWFANLMSIKGDSQTCCHRSLMQRSRRSEHSVLSPRAVNSAPDQLVHPYGDLRGNVLPGNLSTPASILTQYLYKGFPKRYLPNAFKGTQD